jgi:phage-related protein
MTRRIELYKDYFINFYDDQEPKVQEKIEYVLDLIRFERQVPKKFLKLLQNTNGIYEVRVITTFKSIRIFCFFDGSDLIVLTNCIVKKTQKTPKRAIKLAEKLKREYLTNKYK